jgi:flagellin-specific chaperone FliS
MQKSQGSETMKTAHQAYRQTTAISMTRVDMLIALYDTTLRTIARGIASLDIADRERFELERLKACQCIQALLDGINPEIGEVAQNTQQLCLYCATLILTDDRDQWAAAQRILLPLHHGFERIRDSAAAMELRGEIPPLSFSAVLNHASA